MVQYARSVNTAMRHLRSIRGCLVVGIAIPSMLTGCSDSTHSTQIPAPRIFVATDTLDFGSVALGETAYLDLRIGNRGNQELVLNSVKPSCKCVKALMPLDTRIAPGGGLDLQIAFSGMGTAKPKEYALAIISNDTLSRSTAIKVKADVFERVEVMPKRLYMTGVDSHGHTASTIRINDRTVANDLEVKSVSVSSPRLEATLEQRKGNNDPFTVVVEASPGGEEQDFAGEIVLETNCTSAPVVRIPFQVNVLGQYVILPSEFDFGILTSSIEEVVSCKIRRRDSAPFSLGSVDVPNPCLTQLSGEAGTALAEEHEIDLKLDTSGLSGPIEGTVTVEIKKPSETSLSIPIHAFVK